MRNVIAHLICSVALERVTRVSQVGPADRVSQPLSLFLTCQSDTLGHLPENSFPACLWHEPGKNIAPTRLMGNSSNRTTEFWPMKSVRSGQAGDSRRQITPGPRWASLRRIHPKSTRNVGTSPGKSKVSLTYGDYQQS